MDHTAAVLTFDRHGRFIGAIPFGDKGQMLKQLTALVTPVTN